jgi:hypothetical protein
VPTERRIHPAKKRRDVCATRVIGARETSKPLGGGLDEKAIETVKTWKFKPATREGVPVPVRVVVEVTFRLFR